jgi:lysophospholipase L1-like esterase
MDRRWSVLPDAQPIVMALLTPPSLSMPLPDPAAYLLPLAKDLCRTWPDNRNIRIVCHGHSVPSGYFRTPEIRTFDSYPHLLHRFLAERFPWAPINVIVTAIGGENSEAGAARFASDVLTLKPDLVTIDYGLNDRGIGLTRAAAAWKRMLSALSELTVPAILLTPTFDSRAVDPAACDAGEVADHARQIRAFATEAGVALADSHAVWSRYAQQHGSYQALLSQCNHPSRLGHDLVAHEMIRWFPTA